MPTRKEWLNTATTQLQTIGLSTARLDAEIILAHTLRISRTHLHAHLDDELVDRDLEIANARLDLRSDRVPVAYIIGHKEFYGRRFKVTTATLIPRPESEDLIDLIKACVPKNTSLFDDPFRLVDVGTGSGCIGITAKLELPELEVSLLDISPQALKVAANNASTLGADVHIIRSDLLQNYPFKSNSVVANLPYVDESWERSPETEHEPSLALFAGNGGKALIFKLINQAESSIVSGGYLILEADPMQHSDIALHAEKHGFMHHQTKGYAVAFERRS